MRWSLVVQEKNKLTFPILCSCLVRRSPRGINTYGNARVHCLLELKHVFFFTALSVKRNDGGFVLLEHILFDVLFVGDQIQYRIDVRIFNSLAEVLSALATEPLREIPRASPSSYGGGAIGGAGPIEGLEGPFPYCDLDTPMRRPTERNFVCPECSRAYTQQRLLERHVELRHMKRLRYHELC